MAELKLTFPVVIDVNEFYGALNAILLKLATYGEGGPNGGPQVPELRSMIKDFQERLTGSVPPLKCASIILSIEQSVAEGLHLTPSQQSALENMIRECYGHGDIADNQYRSAMRALYY
jgi:hypothetical protein